MALSQAHLEWLESRKLCPEVATNLGVESGIVADGRVVPNDCGNVLIFPYFDRGLVVNEKYRALPKKFWQREGGRRTFYNADVLDDPALQSGKHALVVCEGEPDCIAFITAGYPFVVSVPDGAVPVPDGENPDIVSKDEGAKFEFLWNNAERLRKIQRFVIATDSDAPGRRMAASLVKFLRASRCSRMSYPEGCKDANDVLMKHGSAEVIRHLSEAKEYPVKGIYDLTDFPDEETKLYNIGIDGWSSKLKLFHGAFVVVIGPTNHGKTAFAMEVAANMARDHGWRIGIFSPEQRPTELRDHLRTLYCGGEWSRGGVAKADAWIRRHFKLILGDPVGVGDKDEDITLQWLLDHAEDAVLRHQINMLVIDPWNELEHARAANENMQEYSGRALRQIKRFARQYNVLTALCVHPTKDFVRGKDGKARPVTLYDADGSSHFANKADVGVVVERDESVSAGATITVAKLRYKKHGTMGAYKMRFDAKAQRFRPLDTVSAQMSLVDDR